MYMDSMFIFTDSFLKKAKQYFDHILFENTYIENNSDFLSAISYYSRKNSRLLIIASRTCVDTIFPIIQKWNSMIALINVSCWMMGFTNKWFWDIWDIAKARDFWLQVYEPLYQEHISDILENINTSCYIRFNEHLLREQQVPKTITNTSWIISFQDLNYTWNYWTVLCFWTLLPDVIYWAHYLQEQGFGIDIFGVTNLFSFESDILFESIKKTGKLIVVMDQHLWSLYEIWIRSILFEKWLSPILKFIMPYYQKISSMSAEYMYEHAQIDWPAITQRIQEE